VIASEGGGGVGFYSYVRERPSLNARAYSTESG